MSDYNNTHSNNTNDDLYDDDYITYEETNDDDYIDDDVLDPELDDFDIYRQNHSTNKKSSLNKQKPNRGNQCDKFSNLSVFLQMKTKTDKP